MPGFWVGYAGGWQCCFLGWRRGKWGFLPRWLTELSREMPPLGPPLMVVEPKARKSTNGLGVAAVMGFGGVGWELRLCGAKL